MRKIREILRLNLQMGLSCRNIALSLKCGRSSVSKYVQIARDKALTWEKVQELDDENLSTIFEIQPHNKKDPSRPVPDWEYIRREMKRKGVTLTLLWQEYKQAHPDGYQSTQFAYLYQRYCSKLDVTLRQDYKAGEKMLVDYAGHTVDVVDRNTGEIREAQIFVACLGASSYSYSEATWTQKMADWIDSHVHAWEYFGGVARETIVDNLKSGVTQPCYYEPDVNKTYHDLALHYGTVVLPTRVRKPRDKSKAESAVQVVERWILARLRNRQFFSLPELNNAIKELLVELNERPFQKIEGSRRSNFEQIEKTALMPLPQERYQLSHWKKVRVNMDYHIDLERHYYSVPYRLVKEQVDIRYTNKSVEVFYNGKRVATHMRNAKKGAHTTVNEHMPQKHQRHLDWSPSRIVNWAATVGTSTATIVNQIMQRKKHPQQGYRSCMGIMRLGRVYGKERLEAACERGVRIEGFSYRSVKSILEKGLDKVVEAESSEHKPIRHNNIRGQIYFKQTNQQEQTSC